jgi:hypothetical protein
MASVEWIVVVVFDDGTRQEMFSVATHTEAMEIASGMRERGSKVEVVKSAAD